MRTRSFFLCALVLPAMLHASAAHAQDKAACLEAAGKAQKLRSTHLLVEARDQLRVCAAAACPAVVQSDCVAWLADVEKSLPSVVVTAKNSAGSDLVDVKVSVDGQLLVTKLDGQSVPMNAGVHAFHFETPDGGSLDRQVVVAEGEKNHAVSVTFGGAAAASSGAPGAPAAGPGSTSQSTWKTAGWVVGGVGVAGVVLGAAFGAATLAAKSGDHCVANVCDPGSLSGLRTDSLISTVGFVAGGALLAGGAALVLFGPRGSHEQPARGVRVLPVVTASGGQLVAVGSF